MLEGRIVDTIFRMTKFASSVVACVVILILWRS